MLFFGVLVGTAAAMLFRVGPRETIDADTAAALLPPTLLRSLWRALRFFLLLFLLGTSWLGVLFTPAAALLRGAVLGSGVAALYTAGSYRGLLAALILYAAPAIWSLPCFLAAAGAAFSASRALASMRFGVSAPADRSGALRCVLPVALFIALDALYGFYLAPVLLRQL